MNTSYKLDTMIKVDESLCITCGSLHQGLPGRFDHQEGFPRSHRKRVGPLHRLRPLRGHLSDRGHASALDGS